MHMPGQGVSRQIEKGYLRLTSAPDPETVRPEPVLELALARLIKLLSTREVSYLYAGDQLKVRNGKIKVRNFAAAYHLR